MDLPEVVLSEVFTYLKRVDLVDASTVCKKSRGIIWSHDFSEKVKKTNQLFNDREWLIKTFEKNFDRFQSEVYWECLSVLPKPIVDSIDNEAQRMFCGVLPNGV